MNEIVTVSGHIQNLAFMTYAEFMKFVIEFSQEGGFTSKHVAFINRPVLDAGYLGSVFAALGHFRSPTSDLFSKPIAVGQFMLCLTVEIDFLGRFWLRIPSYEGIDLDQLLKEYCQKPLDEINSRYGFSDNNRRVFIPKKDKNAKIKVEDYQQRLTEQILGDEDRPFKSTFGVYGLIPEEIRHEQIKADPKRIKQLEANHAVSFDEVQKEQRLRRFVSIKCGCSHGRIETQDESPLLFGFLNCSTIEDGQDCQKCGKKILVSDIYQLPAKEFTQLIGSRPHPHGHFLEYWVWDCIQEYRNFLEDGLLKLKQEHAHISKRIDFHHGIKSRIDDHIQDFPKKRDQVLNISDVQQEIEFLEALLEEMNEADPELGVGEKQIFSVYLEDLYAEKLKIEESETYAEAFNRIWEIYVEGRVDEQSQYDGLQSTIQKLNESLERQLADVELETELLNLSSMPDWREVNLTWGRDRATSGELDCMAIVFNSPIYFECKRTLGGNSKSDIIDIFTTVERMGFYKGFIVTTGFKIGSEQVTDHENAIRENREGLELVNLCDSLGIGYIFAETYTKLRQTFFEKLLGETAELFREEFGDTDVVKLTLEFGRRNELL